MNTDFIKGIIPPIITPVDKDERLDEAKFRKQIDYIIDGGVHGILVFGSNGEFYMIEDDDMERGLKITLDQVKDKVPVYFGIGAIKTRKCIELAKMAEKNGATAISVLQPMFLKPSDEELYNHFKAIADAVPNLPMLLYNNPGRVGGYGIPVDMVVKLASEAKNIVGIKDSSGDMTLTAELIRRTIGTNFKVLGGKDSLIFGTMVHGGSGAVCTTANFAPELVCSIYEKYVAGDVNGAREAQFALYPIRLSMDRAPFPVATKDYCNLRGLDIGSCVKPSINTSGNLLEVYRQLLKEADEKTNQILVNRL